MIAFETVDHGTSRSKMKTPAADCSARVSPFFDVATMPVFCPTCQSWSARSEARVPGMVW